MQKPSWRQVDDSSIRAKETDVIGFGKDNKELLETQISPMMLALENNDAHELRIYFAPCVCGEPGEGLDLEEFPQSVRDNIQTSSEMQEMLISSKPLYASTQDVYEVYFSWYLLHMTINECHTVWDDYNARQGSCLIKFEKSHLLDDYQTYANFTTSTYPGDIVHYGIYCEDHLIHVLTNVEPSLRKLSTEEIIARGFGRQ